MKRRIIGIVILVVGLILGALSVKAVFVDGPEIEKKLNEAVYVGTGEINPENDGKIVIVNGTFEITSPAFDDEIGVSLNSIAFSRSKQALQYVKDNTDDDNSYANRHGKLEWKPVGSPVKYTGEGKVGGYTLSKDFIENIGTGSICDKYDEAMLARLGLSYVQDNSSSYKHFVEPSDQTRRNDLEHDIRYYYSLSNLEHNTVVTAVGIQEGNTLKAVPGIANNPMVGELDKEAVIKKNSEEGKGGKIFGIVLSVVALAGGAVLIFKK